MSGTLSHDRLDLVVRVTARGRARKERRVTAVLATAREHRPTGLLRPGRRGFRSCRRSPGIDSRHEADADARLLAALIIYVLFRLAVRNVQLVPGKGQFLGESVYGLVRNSIARDIIGRQDFLQFVPYLTTLFFFILVNNLFGDLPVRSSSRPSRTGSVPDGAGRDRLGRSSHCVGIRQHGFVGYLKHDLCPPGVPWLGADHPARRSSSSRTSSSGRSRSRSGCSPTCSPATCCCWCSSLGGEYMLFVGDLGSS